jgi:putative transposase
MKRKRHLTGEIIRILRKADEGQSVEEACREVNISEETFYRWRRKYGRMEMADAKRFKVLEKENVEALGRTRSWRASTTAYATNASTRRSS